MSENNIVAKIVEQRKKDIAQKGYTFGCNIPQKRNRPVNPFMETKGVILEVKRASPSKGDIAPLLDAAKTALEYKKCGAQAISCLTEENYFKGSLNDLISVCESVRDVAVLRKDFLIDEEEIDIAYRCGADAVLLIAGILSLKKLISMTKKCFELGIRALVEVRTGEDAQKVIETKKIYGETIVCGVNARNLRDFSIDLLVPCQLKEELGGKVIFESGITSSEAAEKIGCMGFTGLLLGEYAARNPQKASEFVKAFKGADENLYGKKMIELSKKISSCKKKPLIKICGITRKEDLLLADSLGADFVGFIFASPYKRNVCGQRFDSMKDELKNVKAFKVAVVTDPLSDEAKIALKYIDEGIIDFIQFHGLDYEKVPKELLERPHYFALTSADEISPLQTENLESKGEARFIQDVKTHAYAETEHMWIAGGITDENAAQIVKKFTPELIDVSGGLEDEGNIGVKNHDKMKKLFKALR